MNKPHRTKGTFFAPEVSTSKAWLSLSGVAPQVYVLFLFKRRFETLRRPGPHGETHRILNERALTFYYTEAKALGISAHRFTRAIDNLYDAGLIDIVEQGNGLHREASVYGLSSRWKKYGQPDFQTVKRIKGRQWVTRGKKQRAETAVEQRTETAVESSAAQTKSSVVGADLGACPADGNGRIL